MKILKDKFLIFIFLFILLLIVPYILALVNSGYIQGTKIQLQNFSYAMSYINAVGSILVIAALIISYQTYIAQKKEMSSQSEIFRFQNFQNQFYRYLDHYNNVLSKKYVISDYTRRGNPTLKSSFLGLARLIDLICKIYFDRNAEVEKALCAEDYSKIFHERLLYVDSRVQSGLDSLKMDLETIVENIAEQHAKIINSAIINSDLSIASYYDANRIISLIYKYFLDCTDEKSKRYNTQFFIDMFFSNYSNDHLCVLILHYYLNASAFDESILRYNLSSLLDKQFTKDYEYIQKYIKKVLQKD